MMTSKTMKVTTRGCLLALVVALLAAPAWAQDQPASTPTAFVQSQVTAVLEIVNRPVERGTEAFTQRQHDLKAAVRGFLDYGELCRRALGEHWGERTPEEQAHFVELMTRLIETNYTVKVGNETVDTTYTVAYEDELVRGENARVTGAVAYERETIAVEIMLLQRDSGWLVWDVVTDDVSIQETYAESFDEIIVEDGWDALVTRIEERLAELEAELVQQSGSAALPPADESAEQTP